MGVCLILSAGLLSGCDTTDPENVVNVSGSTTVLPIAEVAAEQFNKDYPDASVLVSGMGSSAGIEAVSTGNAQIGTVSRELRGSENDLGLTAIPIAYDGIAVIVNPKNNVRSLTTEQLRDVFEGKITNWKDLGGTDSPIHLINRDEASGTREAFQGIVMGEGVFDIGAVVLPGTGQVREVIRRTPGAIGYISIGFVNEDVSPVTIDDVEPTRENVTAKRYPITRSLYFFTHGEVSQATQDYIDYVLSDEVQQGPVMDAGFVPADREVE